MESNLNIEAANALVNNPLQVDPTPKPVTNKTNLNIAAAKESLGKSDNKFTGLDVPGNYMSKFDFELKINADNEELRAQRTPTSTKWVNGIVNFAAIAGTTAAETVTDIAYGIPKAIVNKDANQIFDNDASRYLDSIKDSIKERFPHYYTKAEEDAGLLKGLTSANFWADKVLGGLGFTAGALVGGFGVGAAAKFSTKAAKMAIKGGVKAASIAEATNAVGRTGAAYTGLNAFETGVVYTASAVAESAVEAREGKDSFVRNATNDFILKHGRTPEGTELAEIEDASEVLGNVRFAMNLPIVGASNMIQFGKILKGGTAAFKPNNILKVGKNFIKAPNATKAERIAKGIFNPLTESAQELSQYTVEKYLDNYYRNTYNNENLDKLGQAAESAAFALKESFGTKEGQEQALIGFLIGSIGAPAKTGTGKIGIRMEGGIWDAFRKEDTTQDLYTEALLKELNNYVDSDVFQNSYNSYVKANTNNFFAKAASSFEGIDGVADLAARVSLANKSNTFDSFIEDIKLLKDLSFEEFTKQFGSTNTKIFDKATQDDFVEAMISKAYKLQTLENKINSIYGDKHELARAALYDAAANIEFIGEKITEFEAGLDGKSLIDLNEFTLKEFEKGLNENQVLTNLDAYANTTYSNLSKESKKDLVSKFGEFYYLKDVEKKFLKLYNDIAEGTDFDKKSIEADKRIRAEKAEEAKVKKAQEEKDAFEKDKAIIDEKVKNNTLTQEDIDNLNINHPNFKSEIKHYNETLKSVNDANKTKAAKESLTQEELDGITDENQKGFAMQYPDFYRQVKKRIDNEDFYGLKKDGKIFLRLIEEQDENFINNPSYLYLKNYLENIKDEEVFNNEGTIFANVPAVDDTTPDDAPIVVFDGNINNDVVTPALAEIVLYSVEAFTIEEQISELENVVNSEEFATTEILKKHWQTRKDLLTNKIKQLRQLLKEGIKTGEDVYKTTILLNDIRGTLNEGIDLKKTEYLLSLEEKFRELAKNIENTFPQKLIQDYINYMNDKIKSRGMSIEKDLVKFSGINAYTLDGKNEEYFLTNINQTVVAEEVEDVAEVVGSDITIEVPSPVIELSVEPVIQVEDTTQIVLDNKKLIESLELENEQLEQESLALSEILEQEREKAKLVEVIEEVLTPEVVATIAEEEGITEEEVTEKVIEELRKPERLAIIGEILSALQKAVASIRKVIGSLALAGVFTLSITSFATTVDTNFNTSFDTKVLTEGVVNDVMYSTPAQWAKRFLDKKGLVEVAEEQMVPIAAKPVVVVKPKPSKFFQIIGTVPDSYTAKDSIYSYRSQWDNADGFRYIPVPVKKDLPSEGLKVKGVVGVGHFMLDGSAFNNYSHEYNKDYIAKAKRENHWVPVFKKNADNSVQLSYKKAEDLKTSDNVISPLRQMAFSDITFDKTRNPEGFKKTIREVLLQDGTGTYLIYKDRNAYSRFSGGSVVFIFKDKYDNTIVRDFAGSLNQIENEGIQIQKEYDLKPKDLILGYHDVGSFSAKPKAVNGEIDSKQWSGFNNEGWTGGALLIPIEGNIEPTTKSVPNTPDEASLIGLLGLSLFYKKKLKDNKSLSKEDELIILNRIKEIQITLLQNHNIIKEILSNLETPYIKTQEDFFLAKDSDIEDFEEFQDTLSNMGGGVNVFISNLEKVKREGVNVVLTEEQGKTLAAIKSLSNGSKLVLSIDTDNIQFTKMPKSKEDLEQWIKGVPIKVSTEDGVDIAHLNKTGNIFEGKGKESNVSSKGGLVHLVAEPLLVDALLKNSNEDLVAIRNEVFNFDYKNISANLAAIFELSTGVNGATQVNHLKKLLSRNIDDNTSGEDYRKSLTRWKMIIENDFLATQSLRNRLLSKINQNGVEATVDTEVSRITSGAVQFAVDKDNKFIFRTIKEFSKGKKNVIIASPKLGESAKVLFNLKTGEAVYDRYTEVGEGTRGNDFEQSFQYLIVEGVKGKAVPVKLFRSNLGDNLEARDFVFENILKILESFRKNPEATINNKVNELKDEIRIFTPLNRNAKGSRSTYLSVNTTDKIVEFTLGADNYKIYAFRKDGTPHTTVNMTVNNDLFTGNNAKAKLKDALGKFKRNYDYKNTDNFINPLTGKKENYYDWIIDNDVLSTNVADVKVGKKVVGNIAVKGHYPLVLTLDSTGIKKEEKSEDSTDDTNDSNETGTYGDDLWMFADVRALYANKINIPEITNDVIAKQTKTVLTPQNNSEFFENILANTESTLGKNILNHFITNGKIKIVVLNDSKFFEDSNNKNNGSIFARYSTKHKTIFVNPAKFKTNIHDFINHILVHELGHQLTVDAVMQGEALDKRVKDGYKLNASEKSVHTLYKELNAVYKEYLKKTSDRSSLASINLYEFIAEAISNKNTIRELQNIAFGEEIENTEEVIQVRDNFFDRIINAIVKFFNKLFKTEGVPQIEDYDLYKEFSKILKSNWSILNDFKSTSENDTFVNFAKTNVQFSTVVENFSIEEEEHIVNSLTGFVSQKYQEAKNGSIKETVTETIVNGVKVYSFKDAAINAIKKKIADKVAEIQNSSNPVIRDTKLIQLNLLDRVLVDLENNTTENSLWFKINESLTSKLNYDLEDIDVEAEETANALVKNWEDTTSTKPFADRVSDPIRTLVYNLPKVKKIVYKQEVGKFEVFVDTDTLSGLIEFEDYNLSFNYLRETLVGIVNVDDMMKRLYNITTISPSYGIFYNKIIENKNNIKDALYALMSTPDIDIENERITEDDGEFRFKKAISNIKGEHLISNKWITTFKYKDEVQAFNEDNLKVYYKKLKKGLDINTNLEDSINIAVELLNAIGIAFDKDTIVKVVNAKIEPNKKLVVDKLFLESVKRVFKDYSNNENKFDSYKTYNNLAKLYKKFNIFLGENTFKNVTGQTEGSHRMPSYITSFIDEIVGTKKGNEFAKTALLTRLQGLALDPAHKYSNWLWNTDKVFGMLLTTDGVKDVMNAKLNLKYFEYFNILGQDGLKNTTTGVGKKYSKQNSFEWNLNNAINYLTTTKYDISSELVRAPFITLSNSPTRYDVQFKRFAIKQGELEFTKNGIKLDTNSELFNAIYNTTLQEVERMHQATLFMYETEEVNGVRRVVRDEHGNLIINRKNEDYFEESYHFIVKNGVRIYQQNGKPVGRVFKFHNIPTLNKVDILFMNDIVYKDVYNSVDNLNVIEAAIQKEISSTYTEFYKTNNKFKKILSSFFTVANKKFLNSDYNTFLAESALNYYITNVELQNFIFGATATYANNANVNKRAKAPGSPGEKGSQVEIGDKRNILVINDIVKKSSVYDLMVANSTKDIMEESGVSESVAKSLAVEMLSGYEGMKISDGSGIIMLDFLEKTLKDHGRYSVHKDLFDKIKTKEKLNYSEIKTLLGVFKFHDYSRNFDEGAQRVVSKQFKYAAVPYIPQLFETNPTSGQRTPISRLVESIAIKDENNNIIGYKADEIIYKSGKKFGHFRTNTVVDINNNLLENLDNLVFEKASNSNWTLQQETPTDYEDYTAKLAVQIAKFALTNIPFNHNYVIDGETIKGSDLITLFQDNLVKLLEFSKSVVNDKLGISYDEDGKPRLDINAVVEYLKDSKSKPLSSNLKAALTINEETGKLYLPLDSNTTKDTFMSSLLSVWSNNVTKQQMPGFHAVVASDALLYDVAHNDELDVKFVDGAWVIETWLPAWSADFYVKGELIDINKLDVNLRRMIAYRIPTSGKHSVAVIEVVGFLPKEIGATMIVNKDLIARTGMDFDIDSLYVMVAHHEKIEDGFKKLDTKRKPTNKEYLKDLKAFKIGKQLQETLNQFYDNFSTDYKQLLDEKQLVLNRDSTVIKNIFAANTNLQGLFSEKFKEFEILTETFENAYEELEKELLEFDKLLLTSRTEDSLSDIRKTKNVTDYFIKNAFTPDALESFTLDILKEMSDLHSNYIIESNNMMEDIISNARVGDKLVDKLNKVQNTLLQANIDVIKNINALAMAAKSEYETALFELSENYKQERDNLIKLYADNRLEFNTTAQRQNVTFNAMMAIMSNSIHQLETVEPAQYEETKKLAAELTPKIEINPVNPNGNGVFRNKSVESLLNTGLSASNAGTWAVLQTVRAKSSQTYALTYSLDEINFGVQDLIKKYGVDNVIVNNNLVTIIYDKFGWNNDNTFINVNGKKYSYINGLLTDHSVDSVAEPLPPNVNDVTFNVIGAVNNITGDIDAGILLVNQPIIIKLVNDYYNSNNIVSQKFLGDVIKDTERYLFGSLYNLLVSTSKVKKNEFFEKGLKDTNFRLKNETLNKYLNVDRSLNKVFSLKDLRKNIEDSKRKVLTAEERIEYIKSQIIVLRHFKELDKLGKKILKLSTIFAVDKIGAGPTTAKTHDITYNILQLAEKNDFYVEDVDGETVNLIQAIFPKVFGIDKKSIHPLIEAYYLNSNKAGADAMESLFITENAFFRQAFNDLRFYIPITQYNKIEGIKRGFDKFINTKLYRNNAAFNISELEIKSILGLNNVVVDINKELTFEDFLTYPIFNQMEIVKSMLKLKTTDTHIINYIEVKPETKTQGKKLQFQNIKEDTIEKRLRRSLDEMYYSNDPYIALFAKNLVLYADLAWGLAPVTDSYAKIISLDILVNEFNVGLGLYNFKASEHHISEFSESYLRNNSNILPLTKTYVDWETQKAEGTDWRLNKDNLVLITEEEYENLDSDNKKGILKIINNKPDLSVNSEILIKQVGIINGFMVYKPLSLLGSRNLIETGSNSILDSNKLNDELSDKGIEALREEENKNKAKAESVVEKAKKVIKRIATDIVSFINHSGGAIGADSAWDTIGETFGMINNYHYYYGDKTPKGNKALTADEVKEGVIRVKKTYKILGRPDIAKYYPLHGRNWFQVKNSDAVYAVSAILSPNEVDKKGYTNKSKKSVVEGGTGYAVEMAIQIDKPVYVFNQRKTQNYEIGWYQWDSSENDFIKVGTPALTKDFAGIGTREINVAGENAIKEVYMKTLESLEAEKESTDVTITESNYTRQEVKSNPNTAYVFTENTHSITAFPDRVGGGTAVIRPEPNAFAIVTKKKYDYNTKENVDYTDTDANFKEFTDINNKLIQELKNSEKAKIVFPKGFATDKAKMPTRFAEWLQKELLNNFGLVTELNDTKSGLISKSVNQSAKNTTKEKPSKKGTQTSMDFFNIPDKDAEDKNEQCKTKK